jgi:hypothetical protein
MPEVAVVETRRLVRGVRLPQSVHPATAMLGALMILAAVLLLYAGRHLTFLFDEWSFVVERRGGGLATYLNPHNGHLVLFSVLVFKLLFGIVGLRHHWPYQFVTVALHLLCCYLLYVLLRPRVGPWAALAPVGLLLFLGSAYEDLLWSFQMSFLASVAGGLAALALLERRDRLWDAAAAAMLVWSVTGSGVGLAFLVACAVLLLGQAGPWRRLWVVALPAALLALWYVGWGSSEGITAEAILAAPQYVADAAAGTLAGIAGLGVEWGPALAAATVVALALAWRHRPQAAPPPMLLAALAGVLSFWLLTAIARVASATPAASRYVYVGAVFIALIAAEAGLGAHLRGIGLALLGVLMTGALTGNLNTLRNGERAFRMVGSSTRAALTAIELTASVVPPGYVPEPAFSPQLTAGRYLRARSDLGSPALTLSELRRAPWSIRTQADAVFERADRLAVLPELPRDRCTSPPAGGVVVEVSVAPGRRLTIDTAGGGPATVYVRRLASSFPPGAFASVPAHTNAAISFPLDGAPQIPWAVRMLAPRPLLACVR